MAAFAVSGKIEHKGLTAKQSCRIIIVYNHIAYLHFNDAETPQTWQTERFIRPYFICKNRPRIPQQRYRRHIIEAVELTAGNGAYNSDQEAGNATYATWESEEIATGISVSRVVEETSPESPAEDSFIVTGDAPFEPTAPAYGNPNALRALVFDKPRETVLEFKAGAPVNLAINVSRADIRISVGGDKLTVRYNEWVTYNGQNVERMLPNPNAVSHITYSGGRGTFSIRDR